MKPITAEWVAKAEADFATAQRESRVRKKPNYDAICFHYQQCAEKYLKARLCEVGIPFGKIHDLVALVEAKRLCSFFRKIARSALRLRT